ncbi:hypothetical protein AW49_25300 [Salmonella enterica subsp. enterica serovar Anatum str. USDA-ARS-USMARC-1727]|nr:hypothetical protein AW55_26680 [Salmonella enterica subsp. enterica serovar Anatum str. USDA-ARS-USMARC-1175]AQT23341.1 hypothetical protein AW49_25300 [Salmonella enterica subsp. enterica serovar Anatum str. USDA-ARS-USMARC-1727]AQT30178.1 hypothetical protein AW53_24430 [Salmonella enterica subsp. enterica serovar Anatum str. USDA-ARS-USMARC-1677]
MVTDDEIKRLEAWKRYGVLVNQVNTASPVWPEQPA